jgi:hypothetical protein
MRDFVRIRGAREHDLKDVSLEIPRNALVVFTGVSGSGKSSLAFGKLYAAAQRRYLESVSPYARRLSTKWPCPKSMPRGGCRPAVALQQQRGSPTTRSSVGSVTVLSRSACCRDCQIHPSSDGRSGKRRLGFDQSLLFKLGPEFGGDFALQRIVVLGDLLMASRADDKSDRDIWRC